MAVRLQRRKANTVKPQRYKVNHPSLPETLGGIPTDRSPTIGPASSTPDRKVSGAITWLSHRHGYDRPFSQSELSNRKAYALWRPIDVAEAGFISPSAGYFRPTRTVPHPEMYE